MTLSPVSEPGKRPFIFKLPAADAAYSQLARFLASFRVVESRASITVGRTLSMSIAIDFDKEQAISFAFAPMACALA
jgi:hypothetical protein